MPFIKRIDMGLERFTDAQRDVYSQALEEIKSGKKRTHWMWFIFPQLKGLGNSPMANHYAISNIEEATQYLNHPILGKRLIEITKTLLGLHATTASAIFGYPDDLKLHSSMTLFSQVKNTDPVFQETIDRYFQGKPDSKTLELLNY
jgi:uncharacterized protein (DUF1810 family)